MAAKEGGEGDRGAERGLREVERGKGEGKRGVRFGVSSDVVCVVKVAFTFFLLFIDYIRGTQ